MDYTIQDQMELFSTKGNLPVGRKAYHPSSLLKLYIYGYLNSTSSSRKIERECKRNIEVIWLMGNLVPDHKTIANFRRENAEGISRVFTKLLGLLRDNGYVKGQTISIDGTKVRANAAMSVDLETISKRLENAEEQLSRYLHQLETADSIDEEIETARQEKEQLLAEVSGLQKQRDELKREKEVLENQGVKRISPTDTDCRMMKGRQGMHFGYNVQAAVDAEHKMITSIVVLSKENDKGQLLPMVERVEKELGVRPKEVIADAGYYLLNQIEELETHKNIDCYVAVNYNQEHTKELEHGITFKYLPEQDIYQCSRGGTLRPSKGLKRDNRRGTIARTFFGEHCAECQVKGKCTRSEHRSVYRYNNQQWRDEYENKIKSRQGKAKLKLRKQLSEHPFGTLKYWMGYIPLKTRGKEKVTTEINLYAIAYNLKRLLSVDRFENIMGMLSKSEVRLA